MFRTTITLTILSEEEIPFDADLDWIVREAEEGSYVMAELRKPPLSLTGRQMANALYRAGSDPGFFGLDDAGNRTED